MFRICCKNTENSLFP